MTEVEIIAANASMVQTVARLFDAYRQFYRQPADLAGALWFIGARLERNDSAIFLARPKGADVSDSFGFTQLYPTFASIPMRKAWILSDLFVAPTARNLGVGRLLMQAAHDFAHSTGASAVLLETAKDNVVAQSLYRSMGYQRDEEFDRYELNL